MASNSSHIFFLMKKNSSLVISLILWKFMISPLLLHWLKIVILKNGSELWKINKIITHFFSKFDTHRIKPPALRNNIDASVCGIQQNYRCGMLPLTTLNALQITLGYVHSMDCIQYQFIAKKRRTVNRFCCWWKFQNISF